MCRRRTLESTVNNRAKPIRIKDDSTLTDKLVIAFAECVGTAILLFLGCMGCVTGMSGGEVPHLQISFIFGLAVLISVQVVGHVSGSNINPVITMAAVILGHIPLISAPFYFIGQFLGAILGVGLLKVITPSVLIKASANATGACSPGFNTQISPGTAMISEFLLTLILILVCGGVWDGRNSDKHDSTAVRFGLAVAVLAMAGGPYSGANMNPARSFAPALLNGDWNNHWVWWVGPILGALVGALMYRFLLSKEKIVEAEEEGDIPLNDKQKP